MVQSHLNTYVFLEMDNKYLHHWWKLVINRISVEGLWYILPMNKWSYLNHIKVKIINIQIFKRLSVSLRSSKKLKQLHMSKIYNIQINSSHHHIINIQITINWIYFINLQQYQIILGRYWRKTSIENL